MKCYRRYLTSLKKGDALLPGQPEPACGASVPRGNAGHGHISKEGVWVPPGLERGRKGKKKKGRGGETKEEEGEEGEKHGKNGGEWEGERR